MIISSFSFTLYACLTLGPQRAQKTTFRSWFLPSTLLILWVSCTLQAAGSWASGGVSCPCLPSQYNSSGILVTTDRLSREFWSQIQVGRLARIAPFPVESSPNPRTSKIILNAARLPFSDTGSVTFASLTHLVFTLYQLLIYSFIFTHSCHLFNNTK